MPGKIVIGAVPIGNDLDISYRLIKEIESADIIFVETIDYFYNFIKRNNIVLMNTQVVEFGSYDDKTDMAIDNVLNDKRVLLISDEGTAGIADPGLPLITKLIDLDIEFDVMAGPTAFVPSFLYSGFFKTHGKFVFESFFERSEEKRIKEITELVNEKRPIVFYQELKFINKVIGEFFNIFKEDRNIVICINISRDDKKIFRGRLSEFIDFNFKTLVDDVACIVIDGKL